MNTLELKEYMDRINKTYSDANAYKMLGRNIMTLADRMNTPRAQMWSSETEQIVDLCEPESPRLFTGGENFVGQNSTGYYILQCNTLVVEKIEKFKGLPDTGYILVCYDEDHEKYFIIKRKYGTILTESYGYKFDNIVIDSLDIGDRLEKGTIIYRSKSYDSEMNYGFGVNFLTGYLVAPDVIEDPVYISESAADRLHSTEYGTFKCSINDNDIPLNLYGDKSNYKPFPDIGEELKDATLCAIRRFQYNKALFALKDMRKILNSDNVWYVPYSVAEKVVDVDIYSNKTLDEIPDTPYNMQIKKYLKMQNEYNKRIVEVIGKILDEHESDYYDDELTHVYARAERILNPEYKWQDNGRIFNNIIVNFTVEETIPVEVGSKLCGRYGDKGVISAIFPDWMMPRLPDGRYLDMVCSIHSVGGRNNPGQLIEVETNFLGDQLINRMKTIDDVETKECMLNKFMSLISTPDYANLVRYSVEAKSYEEKKKFFNRMEKNYSLNIFTPPINGVNIFQIGSVYDEFGFKPITLTQNMFGRDIPLLRPIVAGCKYTIKLKHHPKTKFSARSTGSINSKDLPIKSSKSKQGQSIYPNSAIKFGENELFNRLLAMTPEVLANENMLFSSSITGRRDIKQIYENQLFPERIYMNPEATNRNAEIFRICLKARGVSLNLEGDDEF